MRLSFTSFIKKFSRSFIKKFSRTRRGKFLAIVLSVVLMVETFVFSIANATNVVNWGTLANLLIEQMTAPIQTTIKNEFAGLRNFLLRLSQLINILSDFKLVDYQQKLAGVYINEYNNVLMKIFQAKKKASDWIKIVEKGKIIPPVVVGGEVVGDYAEYAEYVVGDLGVIYEVLENRDEFESSGESTSGGFGKLDELSKAQIIVKTRELEAAKIALAQKIADNSASSKILQTLTNDIKNVYKSIDRAQKGGDYTQEQAMKDLLKVQSLNIQIMNELMRRSLNNRILNVSLANKEFNDKRNELLAELQALNLKVKSK